MTELCSECHSKPKSRADDRACECSKSNIDETLSLGRSIGNEHMLMRKY